MLCQRARAFGGISRVSNFRGTGCSPLILGAVQPVKIQWGMNHFPSVDPDSLQAPDQISEAQAIGRAFASFLALFVSVLGILWALKVYFD